VLRLVVSLNLIVIAVAQQNSGLFGACRGTAGVEQSVTCVDGLCRTGVFLGGWGWLHLRKRLLAIHQLMLAFAGTQNLLILVLIV
jgi:hypothetical protein